MESSDKNNYEGRIKEAAEEEGGGQKTRNGSLCHIHDDGFQWESLESPRDTLLAWVDVGEKSLIEVVVKAENL